MAMTHARAYFTPNDLLPYAQSPYGSNPKEAYAQLNRSAFVQRVLHAQRLANRIVDRAEKGHFKMASADQYFRGYGDDITQEGITEITNLVTRAIELRFDAIVKWSRDRTAIVMWNQEKPCAPSENEKQSNLDAKFLRAVLNANREKISAALEAGANPNASVLGRNAYFVVRKDPSLIDFLHDKGVSVDTPDQENTRALDVAKIIADGFNGPRDYVDRLEALTH